MSTGPNEGIGAGPGNPGQKEDVKFEKSQLHPKELDPTGKIVGTLPFEGEAPTGESILEIKNIMTAAQSEAEKVERQAIPSEYKDLVRRFQDSLRNPEKQPESSGDDAQDGANSEGRNSEEE